MSEKHMDYIYSDKDLKQPVKEVHKFIINLVKQNMKNNFSLLDVGCAAGELLYNIRNTFTNYKLLEGIDYSEELIKKAKKDTNLKDIYFSVGDAEKFTLDKEFDFIVSVGVVGYFDCLKPIFTCINKHLKKHGKAFILHLFNKENVDVLIRYRKNPNFTDFQPGWNHHSLQTAKIDAESVGLKFCEAHKFNLSFVDAKKEDPTRSWTTYINGKQKFMNGLGLIYDLYCLEIEK